MPNSVDCFVGRRLRERRLLQGLSQAALGDAVGITFQQIQKYEKGTNRVTAARLWALARVLRCSVGHFFEGFHPPSEKVADYAAILEASPTEREIAQLGSAFAGIEHPALRRQAIATLRAIRDTDRSLRSAAAVEREAS